MSTFGSPTAEQGRVLPVPRFAALAPTHWMAWAPPTAMTLLALAIDLWHLSQAGYGNTYYAAAVRSMTMSWSNFFFGAFDPGGFITVDKPPAFLWAGALSARIFGCSSWSILVPSAIAGATTVGLLWLIVRRYFGPFAATVAALVLTLTPIAVAVNRLNLPEPFFILALVASVGALLRALEGSQPLVGLGGCCGVLVGFAFNVKMLAAWIPGPALALTLVVGAALPLGAAWRAEFPRFFGRLAVFGVVALLVSASWMVVADQWSPAARPYIGGSTDNTVSDLVLGYNGLGRVDGEGQLRGGGRGAPAPVPNNGGAAPRAAGNAAPGNGGPGNNPISRVGGSGQPAARQLAARAGSTAGRPGMWRMFDAANGGQIAWFMPFGILGGVLGLWTWRRDRLRRATVFAWLGWVLLYAGVFSFAQGIYHSYYTAALAPGIAALTGISAAACVEVARRDRRWLVAPLAIAAVTVAEQLEIAHRVPAFYGWVRPLTIGGVLLGCLLLLASAWRRALPPHAGLAFVVVALLLLPGGWSISEAANASVNTTLPQAGPRNGGAAARSFGSQPFDEGAAQLAAWLRAHDDAPSRWDLVVVSAQTASPLIAEYSLSVMPMGGFSGNDPAMTLDKFAELVSAGDVRYVLVDQSRGGGVPLASGPNGVARGAFQGSAPPRPPGALLPTGPGTRAMSGRFGPAQSPPAPAGGPTTVRPVATGASSAVLAAVRQACTPVADSTLPSRYANALYDCAGKADSLE